MSNPVLSDRQKQEIYRLRGKGHDFKTIGRMVRCTPDQARNVWYGLPRSRRAALTATVPVDGRQQTDADRLQLAKLALQREITLARKERHTAPLFKVSPLLW